MTPSEKKIEELKRDMAQLEAELSPIAVAAARDYLGKCAYHIPNLKHQDVTEAENEMTLVGENEPHVNRLFWVLRALLREHLMLHYSPGGTVQIPEDEPETGPARFMAWWRRMMRGGR